MKPRRLFLVLATLNFLNAAYPLLAFVDFFVLFLKLALNWGSVNGPIFFTAPVAGILALLVLLVAAGILSPGICLLFYPRLTPLAAAVAVLSCAASIYQEGELIAIGFSIIPLVTFVITVPSALKDVLSKSAVWQHRTKPPKSFAVLGFLNFLNAAFPGLVAIYSAVEFVGPSRAAVEAKTSAFVGLYTVAIALPAGAMIGLGICLLLFPRHARKAAAATIVLVILHALVAVSIGLKERGTNDEVILYLGLIGTAVFGVIPLITLLSIRRTRMSLVGGE